MSDESLDSPDVDVHAADPGMVHPFHCLRAKGDVWTANRAEIILGSPRVEESFITEAEYGELTGRGAWQKHEDRRRERDDGSRTPYGAALDATRAQRLRTIDSEEFVAYCSAFAANQDVIWTELLATQRRTRRFARLRKVMSAIEKSAEMMARMRDKGQRRRIMFFGAATFGN